MLAAASNDLVVMSDSDTRVTPALLSTIAGEFQDARVGVATCPYRAVAGPSFWSKLEAIGMNTDFMAGILVARMLEGMKFAVGPTIAARRPALESIGGFNRLKDYLAEDFAMGKFAAEAGHGVMLSSYVIEHHIGSTDWRQNAAHRLRWVRSTRRSRPVGYVGQLFIMATPVALLSCAIAPRLWLAAAVRSGDSRGGGVRGGGARAPGARQLGSVAGGGSAGVLFLDRGILREYDCMAREKISGICGWEIRTGDIV